MYILNGMLYIRGKSLIPLSILILDAIILSVLGTVLSGAGPSVLVISKKNNLDKVKSLIKETWNELSINVQLYNMPIETNGAIVVEE